jgi:hypothetical protein
MKKIILLAAMFLTAALFGPAAEAGRIPFNGTLAANEDFRLLGDPPFGFFVDGAGTATSTKLGSFTWVYSFLVAFSDVNPLTTPGCARFIAANGDNIFTSSTGVTIPTADPNVSNIIETHTVTGGTGRFEGAKGTFTINRVITVENQEVLYGTTSGSFNGSIIVRGNPH